MALDGVRSFLNNHRGATIIAISGLIAVSLGITCYQVMAFENKDQIAKHDYFTTDDGKTLFVDSVDKIPPFEHEGKQAVRAQVYQCSGKQFVAYLERYTPEARAVIIDSRDPAKQTPDKPGQPPAYVFKLQAAQVKGREIKRPGDKEWVPASKRDLVTAIQTVTTPPGMSGIPEPVRP